MTHQNVVPITTDPTLHLIRDPENTGGLTVRAWDTNGLRYREVKLTPSEADQLVLTAMALTKPVGVASRTYTSAEEAVRSWQRQAAEIWQRETLDAERNQILQDAGLSRHWEGCNPATRTLVDMVIAGRRKAEQK